MIGGGIVVFFFKTFIIDGKNSTIETLTTSRDAAVAELSRHGIKFPEDAEWKNSPIYARQLVAKDALESASETLQKRADKFATNELAPDDAMQGGDLLRFEIPETLSKAKIERLDITEAERLLEKLASSYPDIKQKSYHALSVELKRLSTQLPRKPIP